MCTFLARVLLALPDIKQCCKVVAVVLENNSTILCLCDFSHNICKDVSLRHELISLFVEYVDAFTGSTLITIPSWKINPVSKNQFLNNFSI